MTETGATPKQDEDDELDNASKKIITTLKAAYLGFFFIVIVPSLAITFPGLIADHEASWLKEAMTVMKYTTIAFVSLLVLFFTAAATLQLYKALSIARSKKLTKDPKQNG